MELPIVFIFILAILLALPLAYVVGQYNGLVSLRNHIRESWSNVDTELKRRHDLVPNLVGVVKGYAAHEQTVLERVVELRNRALEAGDVGERSGRENELAAGIAGILAVVENYPDLKADAQFLRLQHELVMTEDRIQAARRFYNGNVREYQNKCDAFPSNLVARSFGFQPAGYFEAGSVEREAPRVHYP